MVLAGTLFFLEQIISDIKYLYEYRYGIERKNNKKEY